MSCLDLSTYSTFCVPDIASIDLLFSQNGRLWLPVCHTTELPPPAPGNAYSLSMLSLDKYVFFILKD